MFKFLLQPYPMWDNKQNKIYLSISISVIVFLCLFIFEPFGINRVETQDSVIVFIGYSLLCLLILLLFQFTLPKSFPQIFKEKDWKVYKEILFILLIIAGVSLGFILYSLWLEVIPLSIGEVLYNESIIISTAFLPVTLMVISKYFFLLFRNKKRGKMLSEKLYRKTRMPVFPQTIVNLLPETASEKFVIESKDIYYIAAADNRIEVQVKLDDSVKQMMLNNTIRNAHGSIKRFSNFYRCHRTFIVNLDKVESITGNAQGFKLILFETEKQIPVSRTLSKELTQRLSI